jgi:hypothetical protein
VAERKESVDLTEAELDALGTVFQAAVRAGLVAFLSEEGGLEFEVAIGGAVVAMGKAEDRFAPHTTHDRLLVAPFIANLDQKRAELKERGA